MSTSSTSRTALQMKTTVSGRPFLKDMHDLFSAFVNSVNITTNRNIFKTYPNTFTAEDVITTLSHLNFSQTISHPDPQDASRVVTTTVTTTFSMTKEMARHLCGQFLEARLIFDAADPTEKVMMLRPDGIYGLTCKGNIVYETFLREAENAVLTASDSAPTELSSRQNISWTTPSGTLLCLPREGEDDQLTFSHSTIESTFRAFAGPTPNYTEKESNVPVPIAKNSKDRVTVSSSSGVSTSEEGPGLIGIRVKDRQQTFRKLRAAFKGAGAIDWLLANTTALNRSEAVTVANQFVQNGYIQLASSDSEKEVEIFDSSQVIYQLSDEGKGIAGWKETDSNGSALSQFSDKKIPVPGTKSTGVLNLGATPADGFASKSSKSIWGSITSKGSSVGDTEPKPFQKLEPRAPVAPTSVLLKDPKEVKANANTTTAQRLTLVLADTELRTLFKEFLQSMFCQENLEFYTDVVDFKTKFGEAQKTPEEKSKMIQRAIEIYNIYLCPGAEKELNINHTVRRDMVNKMTAVMEQVSPTTTTTTTTTTTREPTSVDPTVVEPEMTSNVFDKIEHHIFHLMASDSLPKFCRTPVFKEEITINFYPGLSLPPGGPLMSMSTFLESMENEENGNKGAKNRATPLPGPIRTSLIPRATSNLTRSPSIKEQDPVTPEIDVLQSSRKLSRTGSIKSRNSITQEFDIFQSSRGGSQRPSSPAPLNRSPSVKERNVVTPDIDIFQSSRGGSPHPPSPMRSPSRNSIDPQRTPSRTSIDVQRSPSKTSIDSKRSRSMSSEQNLNTPDIFRSSRSQHL